MKTLIKKSQEKVNFKKNPLTTREISRTLNTLEYNNDSITIKNFLDLNSRFFIWKFESSDKLNCLTELSIVSREAAKISGGDSLEEIISKATEKVVIYFYKGNYKDPYNPEETIVRHNMKITIFTSYSGKEGFSFLHQSLRVYMEPYDYSLGTIVPTNKGILPFLQAWIDNLSVVSGRFKNKVANYTQFHLPPLEEAYAEWYKNKVLNK